MTITGGSALPKDDIERMVKDAEAHAEEDKTRREEAETRNQAETLVYQTEKFLKDNDDKLPEDLKGKVKAAIDESNEALKGTDSTKIRESIEKLNTASQELGTALYAVTVAASLRALFPGPLVGDARVAGFEPAPRIKRGVGDRPRRESSRAGAR